ncbi:MAG: class I SAM-dependent methyltransferase [Planctomycetota bacterium]
MNPCRICGNAESNRLHTAKEARFGTGEAFAYVECGACGCIQIGEIPEDLSRHYPADYYSFRSRKRRAGDAFRTFVCRVRARFCLKSGSVVGALFRRFFREPSRYRWFRNAGLRFDAKVLDVGCGSGGVLLRMRMDGFRDLTGVDKFIDEEQAKEDRVKIVKAEVSALDETYDFILINHTLEHVDDPLRLLRDVRERLRPSGVVLVRIPLAGTWAWREYSTDWIQLDPPRHLHLLTVKSLEHLAKEAGLAVDKVVFDSRDLQFWGSEQARQGIALVAENSHGENPATSIFTREKIDEFKERAEELNRKGDGDQACFFLKRR